MPGLSFNQCLTAGHQAWPPTRVISSQSKVFVGGIAVVREDDMILEHTETKKPYETHGGKVISRTNKVFVQGKKAASIADPISCGDTIAQGSPKTFIH